MSLTVHLPRPPSTAVRSGPPLVVVLGLPGTDATGRARAFADAIGWASASSGAALRRAAADGTALGRHVDAAIRTGDLVADHLAVGLARTILEAHADAPGLVLAGFPRTLAQARALTGLAPGAVRWCVTLVAPRTTLTARIRARAHPDDSEYSVHRRFLTFDRATRPVVGAYAQRGLVRFVDVRREVAVLEQRLERLLGGGPVVAFRLRRGGEIAWISGAAEHVVGRPPHALVGHDAADFCHPDDHLAVFDAVKRVRATGAPQDFAARFLHPDGSVRHLEGRCFLADGDGDVADRDIDAIATDVTPHREAERLRAFLTAGAGHELRTPLAFLVTSLHLLRDGLVDPATADGRDLVDRMIGTTERLARLANRLLTLQRLELTTTLPDRAPTAVGSVVVDAARSAPTPRGVTVAVHDDTAGAVLTGDADNLAQAVVNLVDNAVAHSPDGQTVTVSARVVGSRLVVTVRDRGPGIPVEARPTAFDPFRRSAGTRPGGAGLGLAIVRSIARLHSGSVAVVDPPTGPGAQFVLVLQGAETPGADGPAEPPGQAAGPPGGAR